MNIRAISDVVSDLGEGPIWSPQTNCVTWTDITQNKYHTADLSTGATQSFSAPSMVGAIALTHGGDYVAATQEGFAHVSIDGKFSPLHTFLHPLTILSSMLRISLVVRPSPVALEV